MSSTSLVPAEAGSTFPPVTAPNAIAPATQSPAAIDWAAINLYRQMIYGSVEDGCAELFRGLAESGTLRQGASFGSVAVPAGRGSGTLAAAMERWAADGCAIYTLPMPLDAKSLADTKGTKDRVCACTVIITDIDTGDTDAKLAYLRARVGTPTMVVKSGGITKTGHPKLHIYWKLTEPTDNLLLVARLREQVAIKAGGDPSFKNIAQLIRVPGTPYGKGGVASRCEIEEHNPRQEYDLDDLAEAVEAMQPTTGINAPPSATPLLRDGGVNFSRHAGTETQPERTKGVLLNRVHPGGVDGITRHDSFNVAAGHFIRRYRDGLITRAQLDEEIRGWVVACMADPWPDSHIDKELKALIAVDEKANGPIEAPGGNSESAEAIRAHGPQSLFAPLPKATVFPVDCLGDELGKAAAAIADKVQAPLPIAGVSVLAAVAVAAQALRDVELPTGERKPLSGFFVSVAASGERKSTVDSHALKAVRRREDELRREHAPQLKLYIRRKKAWEAACNRILKPVGKEKLSVEEIDRQLAALGSEPEPPLEPMLTCPEPTFEGLIKLMQVGQPSMGLFADEGGQFVGGFGMSPDHKLKTGAALSSAWDGKEIKRVRAGDGAVSLHGRRLSMHLMMQHQVSTAFLSDEQLTDQGLLSRVLVTAPDNIVGTRWWRDPTDEGQEAIARYEEKLLEILRHPLPLAKDTKNELTPPRLQFSPDAKALYVAFVNEVEAQLGAEGSLRPICGFANKLPEHASRLAAVLTVFEDPTVEALSLQAMERGIGLARFFAGELMRLKMAGWLDPTVAKAECLRLWVRDIWKEDHISVRAITQYGPPEFRKSAAENKRLVAILAEHGWLVAEPAGATLKEERARKAWRVVREGGPL